MPVYYAKPLDAAKPPVILVAMEVFGLHEHIKDVTRRLGKLGAFALAPDYYFQLGDLTGISNTASYMRFVIFCLTYKDSCATKIPSPKNNYTILVFRDRAILIKNPTKRAHQQWDLHFTLLLIRHPPDAGLLTLRLRLSTDPPATERLTDALCYAA
jgi:Dienelactone hydrolase family